MSNLAEYESQLAAVEQALLTNENADECAALLALKTDLLEVVNLTKEVLAATNSNLNSDDADNEAANSQPDDEDEMMRFRREIDQLDAEKTNDDSRNTKEVFENSNNSNNTENVADAKADEDGIISSQIKELRATLEELVGQKCSAPHQHSWGAITYHNAMVCGVEDTFDVKQNGQLDVRLRVLFMNPTHREMVPCSYYLEGDCRFDEEHCHYSHGELVAADDLRAYMAPDFERLTRNCVVLAKLKDRIWHRGRVLCTNFIEKTCRIRLENKAATEREQDFEFQDLLPIFHDEDLSSGSSDDDNDVASESDSESDELDEIELARRTQLIEQSLFTFKPTQALGEWEKHTRGIGSKLMAKMGYITGTGLGSDGRGIVVPVSAQILPQGRSLDHCMELREAANGDKDLFSVEKKLLREKKKQATLNVKAYERETQRTDMFSFLNENIFANEGTENTKLQQRKDNGKEKNLQQHTTKSLNVESMRIADDIKRKEREINKIQESMKRNASSGSDVQKRLQMQLNARNQELQVLKNEEKTLTKEQATRKTKDKLCVF